MTISGLSALRTMNACRIARRSVVGEIENTASGGCSLIGGKGNAREPIGVPTGSSSLSSLRKNVAMINVGEKNLDCDGVLWR